MAIRVEFYGVARLRAGVATTTIEAEDALTLGKVFAAVRQTFPAVAQYCFEQDRLHPSFVANIDGERFVRDLSTPLAANAVVLLLSTDAGG